MGLFVTGGTKIAVPSECTEAKGSTHHPKEDKSLRLRVASFSYCKDLVSIMITHRPV